MRDVRIGYFPLNPDLRGKIAKTAAQHDTHRGLPVTQGPDDPHRLLYLL